MAAYKKPKSNSPSVHIESILHAEQFLLKKN